MNSRSSLCLPTLLVVLAVVLSACTTAPSDPQPSSPETATESGTDAPPDTDPDTAPRWPEIAETSSTGVQNLATRTISDNEDQIHVVIPQLEGHGQFDDELSRWAEAEVDAFREDYIDPQEGGDVEDGAPEEDGPADEEPVSRASLSVSWAATAVSEQILGFVMHSTLSPGASVGEEQRTFWYDPQDGSLLTWQDLLADDALGTLLPQIRSALAEQGVDVETAQLQEALEDGEPAVGFTAEGELFIGFDDYELTAGSEGSPAVALPDPQGHGWLSEVGEAARQATLHPEVGAVPVAPEAPSPAEVDCEAEKCVALTFDDGPSGDSTPRLLDILAQEQVPATFFVLGSQAEAFPSVLADEVAAGHEIGNHTWSHPDLRSASESTVEDEITRTNEQVQETAAGQPVLLRPPYGSTGQSVAQIARQEGMAQILWDIDTRDWDHHDPEQTVAAAREAQAGSIILMHDIHDTTVDAVPEVIRALREEGFTFVTVSTLLGDVEPGEVYSRQG